MLMRNKCMFKDLILFYKHYLDKDKMAIKCNQQTTWKTVRYHNIWIVHEHEIKNRN